MPKEIVICPTCDEFVGDIGKLDVCPCCGHSLAGYGSQEND